MLRQPLSKQALFGLAVALLVSLFFSQWIASEYRQQQFAKQQIQQWSIQGQVLGPMISQHIQEKKNLQPLLVKWLETHVGIQSITVAGIKKMPGYRSKRIVAHTDIMQKSGEFQPKRYSKDTRYLYDLAKSVARHVSTNRTENTFRKAHIVSNWEEKTLQLAFPLYLKNKVSAALVLKIERPKPPKSDIQFLAYVGTGLGLLAIALLFIPQKRRYTVIAASSFFILVVGLYSISTFHRFEQQAIDSASHMLSLAQHETKDRAIAAESLLVDIYERPLGWITPELTLNQHAIQDYLARPMTQLRNFFVLIGGLSLLFLVFIASGAASRTIATLKEHRQAYSYAMPAIIGMTILVFFPFAYGIMLSFTDTNLFNESLPLSERWIGFGNYVSILGDFNVVAADGEAWSVNYQNFYWTLLFTIFWTVTNVFFSVLIGLILALALNTEGLKGKAIYRVLLILPWAIPNYITALIWKGMFHQQFGVVNQLIQLFGGNAVAWFDNVGSSFMTVLMTNVWLGFPFMMVVLLGGLQSISSDMYEAARIDGANRWQQFRYITLPSLKPTIIPAVILSVVWTFNMFNVIYLVNQGEPAGSNEILLTQAYKIGFEKYQYAYAAAYSVVIFAILFIYGIFQNKVSKATEANA
ncbi:carbohydrate ABC transporter permease [Algicola sagamiensis]|uniref:carbohydrate ABC transporter permease n=1 Tax=Algicola sagamiensis TaxID=163869 RepID=UPI000372FBA6|nr:sugar ABC transporter permease [Algicola sagamiensis]